MMKYLTTNSKDIIRITEEGTYTDNPERLHLEIITLPKNDISSPVFAEMLLSLSEIRLLRAMLDESITAIETPNFEIGMKVRNRYHSRDAGMPILDRKYVVSDYGTEQWEYYIDYGNAQVWERQSVLVEAE